jgi:hypothetical protein
MAQLKVFTLGNLGCCCGTGGTGVCTAHICVTGCPSGTEVVGATVTVKDGGTTVGSCNTIDVGGGQACCAVIINIAGTYEVDVSAAGYKPYNGTQSLTCGGTVTIKLQPSTAPASVSFSVTGCCSQPLPGATITLSDGQSCTTDASGACNFWIGKAGTYTYTISKTRFADATGSVSVPDCGTTTISIGKTLSPASGYVCGGGGADPIPTTLHLSDSVYGACILNYSVTAPNPNLSPGIFWGIIHGASFPGACNCPASTFDIGYALAPGCGSVSGTAYYNGATYVACFFGAVQHHCPANPSACGPTCTAFGQNIYQNCCDIVNTGTCTVAEYGSASLAGGTGGGAIPFDYSVAIPAPSPGCGSGFAWPSGATITVTE